MAVRLLIYMMLFSQLLMGCLEVGPAMPTFKKTYAGRGNDENLEPAVELPPEVIVLPSPAEDLIPSSAQIEAEPVKSGIKLYVLYCSTCHKAYDESNKRNIGITAGQIMDAYVRNFPKHRGNPWPKGDMEAWGIEKALQIPLGGEPDKAGGGIATTQEKPEEADLPSLEPGKKPDRPRLVKNANERFQNER